MQNKTPSARGRGRNEEICTHRGGVVAVPPVVKPVRVPVPPAVVPVQVPNIQVAVRVAVAYEAPSMPPPFECSNGLYRIREQNSPSASYQVFSFFESSAYTAPSQTLAGDALGVWILASVAGNRNRPRMHLSPLTVYQNKKRGPAFGNAGPKDQVPRTKRGQRNGGLEFNLHATQRGCGRPRRGRARRSPSSTRGRSNRDSGR